MANPKECSVEVCHRPAVQRGFCGAHYKRAWRHGDPLAGYVGRGVLQDTLDRLRREETDDCVLWPHKVNDSGYAILTIDGKSRRAHVIVCEVQHGQRPPGKSEVAHSCNTPRCVNYRHLRWATPQENAADKKERSASQLTPVQVLDIRRRYAARSGTYRGMAVEYGVSAVTIHSIVKRRTWKWLS